MTHDLPRNGRNGIDGRRWGPKFVRFPGPAPDDLDELFGEYAKARRHGDAGDEQQASAASSAASAGASVRSMESKGRGRPRGTYGGSELRRRIAEAQQAGPAASDDPAPGSIEYARKAREAKLAAQKASLASAEKQGLVKCQALVGAAGQEQGYGDLVSCATAGSSTQQKVLEAVVSAAGHDTSDVLVEKLFDGAMHTMSFRALESLTGERNFYRRIIAVARAVQEASCYMWSLLLAMAGNLVSSSPDLQPLLWIVRLRYDETPTKVRVEEPEVDTLLGKDGKAHIESTSTAATHAKLLQVEFSCGLLMQNVATQQHTLVTEQIPACLFPLKSTSGENTALALMRVLNSVYGLREFASKCKFAIRHSCSDAAQANFKAERILTSQFPDWVPLHTVCDIHKLYRITRTAMSSLDFDVSGILSFALALADPGSAAALRQTLGGIISRKLALRLKPRVKS